MASDLNQPIVIDNGSGTIKAGTAGTEKPAEMFPAYVGRPKHERVMAGGSAQEDIFVGNRAEELRGILRLSYPTQHGVTTDWKDMESIWQYTYSKLNIAQPDEHPVLLTEPPLNPRSNRERAAEVFFEVFQAPAFLTQIQAVLSLYASGRVTGVVLDSGDGVTHAVPVYEGFSMPHAVNRIDVGGRDVTEHMQTLLRKAGYTFHTSAEMEIVKSIKEKIAYVAFNVEKTAQDMSEDVSPEIAYRMPDGSVIQVGAERFRAPEVLFNPSIIGLEYIGIHECLVNAICKSDLDIRRTLYSSIVLAGGSTMFSGFGDRLLSEVRKLSPRDLKLKIYAPAERNLSCWVGGSILASLNTFSKMWISKEEFNEMGTNAVHRKTFT